VRAATQQAPCGCQLLRDAAREPDPTARSTIEMDALVAQLAWGCPKATGRAPDGAGLGPAQREAADRVATLTGFAGKDTCPLWYASLPWVHRAARAYRWRESPLFGAIEPEPSAVLVDAVEQVENGVTARQAYDAEKWRERMEAERKAREQG
jgi:hypothetical protein